MDNSRRRLAADPHRPEYHFLPPSNWMNDPVGLAQWRRRYHLFYQHNPAGPFWGRPEWGHAVSDDLVHWRDLPVALAPDPNGPDRDGCFSGCLVDNGGVATVLYTGVWPECTCLATSRDELLAIWEKHPANPIIPGPPPGLAVTGFRDHCAWNDEGAWYQVIGSGIPGVGGAALLYRSPNLVDWEYRYPLCTGDVTEPFGLPTGTIWECPDFFELDGKRVLVVSPYDDHGQVALTPLWFMGRYAARRFSPRSAGLLDAGGNIFYAPQTFRDEAGRRIMFGWIKEDRSPAAQVAAGWAGLASLPRVLSAGPAGELRMEPAPEVQALRGRWAGATGSEEAARVLSSIEGDALELDAEFSPFTGTPREPGVPFGLKLRRSPDGAEETLVVYEPETERLVVDRTRASLDPETGRALQSGLLPLVPGQTLRLRIFIDGSALEIFANDTFCLTSRIYPTRGESLGLSLVPGSAEVQRLDVWEMGSIWGDRG